MTQERMTTYLRCTTCGLDKAWPHGFADAITATCWKCVWERHLKSEHKRWWKQKVTAPAKRAARERYERDEVARRIDEASTEAAARTAARVLTEEAS